MTPIERAARALCELAGNPPMAKMDGKPLWMSYIPEVRTVLGAIREPSDAMIYHASNSDKDEAACEDVWQAMIDAALEEG